MAGAAAADFHTPRRALPRQARDKHSSMRRMLDKTASCSGDQAWRPRMLGPWGPKAPPKRARGPLGRVRVRG